MQRYRIRHLPVVDGEHRVIGMLSDRDLRPLFGDSARTQDVEGFRVKDWMSNRVISAGPNDTCRFAARIFSDRSIGALPIVDEQMHLVGILSYVDVLRVLTEREMES